MIFSNITVSNNTEKKNTAERPQIWQGITRNTRWCMEAIEDKVLISMPTIKQLLYKIYIYPAKVDCSGYLSWGEQELLSRSQCSSHSNRLMSKRSNSVQLSTCVPHVKSRSSSHCLSFTNRRNFFFPVSIHIPYQYTFQCMFQVRMGQSCLLKIQHLWILIELESTAE